MDFLLDILVALLLAFAGGLFSVGKKKKRNKVSEMAGIRSESCLSSDEAKGILFGTVTAGNGDSPVESGENVHMPSPSGTEQAESGSGCNVPELQAIQASGKKGETDRNDFAGHNEVHDCGRFRCSASEIKTDARRLVIYSEMMKPKYKEF